MYLVTFHHCSYITFTKGKSTSKLTFLSSGVSWLISMLKFSEFHSQSWLLKYSSRLMALWRRLKMRIILEWDREGGGGQRLGHTWPWFQTLRQISASLTAVFDQTAAGRGHRWGRGTCGWPGSSTGWSGSWRWCLRWACGKPAPGGSFWRTTSHGALQNVRDRGNYLRYAQTGQTV